MWGFEPIIAMRATCSRRWRSGRCGICLRCFLPYGALDQEIPGETLAVAGKFVGLSSDATTGLLAASANVLALLAIIKDLKARDKVITLAFAVCCAFLFGDHLSFTANFQPSLIVPVLLGKLSAGICAIVFANLLAVKKAEQLEAEQVEADLAEKAEKALQPAYEEQI